MSSRLVDKYRPKVWGEIIGQDKIVKSVKAIIDRNTSYPNFLFVGPPGCGKTVLAEVFANEGKFEKKEFNASDDRTLAFMRETIKKVAQFSGQRIIILDEADNMINAAQMALKRIMETSSAIFILCANDEWKIDDAIKSRCAIFRFPRISDDALGKRLVEIIKLEGYKIVDNPTVSAGLLALVMDSRGDMRTALNSLETVVDSNGSITPDSVLLGLGATGLPLIAMMKALEGDFFSAKEYIEKAYVEGNYNPRTAFKQLYEAIPTLNISTEMKVRMFEKLGEIERGVLVGGDPIIQIVTYLAFIWLLPHASGCPLIK
jgi:DNA polymerase III delta prime subunit